MPRIAGEGKPYKETRTKTVKNRKTGKTKTVEYVLWCWRIELPRKPNGDRDYTVIRRKNRNDLIPAKRELLEKLANGQPLKRDSTTVASWLEYWLEHIAKPRLRPRVHRNYVSSVKCNIVPHIGKVKLSDLAPQHIRHMLTAIMKTGKSPRTAEVAYNLLHKALDDAKKEPGLGLRQNVVELVDKPKPASSIQDPGAQKALPSGQGRVQKPRTALMSDQARAVVRTALDNNDPLAVRWAMALLTGVRQGECIGLTTDRVDLDRGLLDLSWSLQRVPLKRKKGDPLPLADVYPVEMFDIRPGFELRPLYRGLCLVRPKTAKSTRVVPMPEPLRILMQAHMESARPNPYKLVWVNANGKPLRPQEDDERAWAAALAAAGAPDVVLHAARHTTATLLLEAGVPEDVRMAIMGHSSAAAQRIYAHADQGVKRAGLSTLNNLIDGGDEPRALAS